MKKFFSSFLIFLLIQTSSTIGIKTDNTQVCENKAQVVSSKSIKNIENKTEGENLKNVLKEKDAQFGINKQNAEKFNQPKNSNEKSTSKSIKPKIKNCVNTVLTVTVNTVSQIFEQAVKIIPYVLLKLFL